MLGRMISQRPATSREDLLAAAELMAGPWLAGSELAFATPAGIEWWHASSWPDALEDHLRLWSDGDDVAAWSWHDQGEVEWMAWTGDRDRDRAVVATILEDALAATPTAALGSWSDEADMDTVELLARHGFVPHGRRLSQWQHRAEDGMTAPASLPDGYVARGLRGAEEIEARVEVHRAAFAPSRLSAEKYERLITLPHYRFDLDLVVEAPDGSLAAFALAWWDPVARVGEFEPVGTHPEHQRRGLGRGLLVHGLSRFAELGATVVQVYSDADDPGPEALYASAGFQRHSQHRRFERPAPAGAAPPDQPSPNVPSH
jgi:mycothiol synthase